MKVKEHYQKEQEKKLEEEWSFAEWLDYYSKEPTSDELDKMEKESQDKKRFSYPLNNPYYFPLQGA